MSNRTETKWKEHLDRYHAFIDKMCRFPTARDEFDGYALGTWFMYQRKLYRQEKLSSDKIKALDAIHPAWKGNTEERKDAEKQMLLGSDWKRFLAEEQIPIDEYYKEEDDLFLCLANKCYDVYSLLENIGSSWTTGLSKLDLQDCYALVLPQWDPAYGKLLDCLYGIGVQYGGEPAQKVKEMKSFSFRSKEDMAEKLEAVMECLTGPEQDVIRRRFGIPPYDSVSTLNEIGKALSVSRESARLLEASALRKMRSVAMQTDIR